MDDIIFVKSSPRAKPKAPRSSSVPARRRLKAPISPSHFVPASDPIDLGSPPAFQRQARTPKPPRSLKDEGQLQLGYFLAREKHSVDAYVAKLERALERKHDGLIIGDEFLHKKVAVLRAQKERQKTSYEAETKALRERNAVLTAEKAALKTGSTSDDEIRELKKVKATLEGRVAILDNQNLTLRAQVVGLAGELEEQKKREQDATLSTETQTLRQQNAALQTANTTLEANISELNAKIHCYHAKVLGLQQSIQDQDSASEQTQALTTPLHQHIFTLEAEKAILESTISDLTARIAALETKTSDLKSRLRTQKSLTKEALAAPEKQEKQGKKADRKVKKSARRIQALETALAARDQAVLALQSDVEAKETEMAALQVSLAHQHTRLTQALVSPEKQAKQAKKADPKAKETARRIQALETALISKEQHVAALQSDVEAKETEIHCLHASLAQQHTGLTQALHDRSARINEISRELEGITTAKDEVQRAHDTLAHEMGRVRDTNGALKQNVAGMYARYKALWKLNGKVVRKLGRLMGEEKRERVERYRGVKLKELEEWRASVG